MSSMPSLNPFASDHVPFINANIPALLTIEGADSAHENVHSANDTLDHINYGLALDIVRMNVAATSLKLGIMRLASGTDSASINQLLLDDSPGMVPQSMLLI